MRNLISKLRFERLRKLLGSESAQASVKSEKPEILEIQEAVALVEAMSCDMIAHCAGDEAPEGYGRTGLSTINAFARPVAGVELSSVAETVAAGAGMAMSGYRSAVFLPGDHLSEGYSQLQSIAQRLVPMVVHTAFREGFGAGSSHAGYHGASDLGLFQVMPRSVQQAIDVTLLSRWLTERTLLPGVVAVDRRVAELASLPSADVLRSFLGDRDSQFSSPNAAQFLLFGGRRFPAPAWYDFDRPVSFGSLQGSNDAASAAVGRQVFFHGHLSGLLEQGMQQLSALTGRTLSLVEDLNLDQSDLVIVTQGSSFETAEAAAQYLRQEKGWGVGVLGVTWLRPFPAAAIQKALSRKRGIAVLECTSASLAEEGTLVRELRRAAPREDPVWVSGSFGLHGQPLAVGQVIDLVSELREKKPRSRVWLGIVTGAAKIGEYPKRQGLIKSVASDYPELVQNTITARDVEKLSGASQKTVQWVGSSNWEVSDVIRRLGESCTSANGTKLRGFGWFPEPGVLSVRVSSGAAGIPIPEGGSTVDVLLLGRHGLDLIYNPLADVGEGRSVVVESDRSPFEIWQLMPEFWRSEIRRLKLRLYRLEGDFEQLAAAANALLSGSVDLPFEEIRWEDLGEPSSDPDQLPALIRRVSDVGAEYDNLPRFWGEVMQPKRGGISDNFPDPLVALGAVPPYTAALARPRGTALPNIPVLDAEKCTGCGRCWPVCPDSAIGVTVTGIQELLDAAADIAGAEGRAAAAVKRSHRPLSSRVASVIKEKKLTSLEGSLLEELYRPILEKSGASEDERKEQASTFGATSAVVDRLNPVICDPFFRQSEAAEKGSGKLMVLAINPDACQGCQLCIVSCPESALTPFDRSGSVRLDAQETWGAWEMLPDTPEETIEQSQGRLDLGVLAARLLSRHSSQVQAVGSFGEPGSGERLAARLITASAESIFQARLAGQAREAIRVSGELREQVHAQLAKGLVEADPQTIEATLSSLPRHRVSLGELSDRLSALGKAVSVDPVKTLRLAQAAHELETEAWQLEEGVHGLGRSRFGVVIASHRIARWAGRFPNHPYNSPLVVEVSPEGAGLVIGLAEAAALRHVEQVRLLRRGALYLENPPDLPGRLAELEDLRWEDLSPGEREGCPPILVFADEGGLTRQGLGALSRLLSRNLPVKLILFDSRGLNQHAPEPALLGMGFPATFVLCGSLGFLPHLAEGLTKALGYPGAALIHIHTPLPQEQGFEPSATIERSRQAVWARVHPLFSYDPSLEGDFGLRVSLEGNPLEHEDWTDLKPVEWALGEKRFEALFSLVGGEDKVVDWLEYLELATDERAGLRPVVGEGENLRAVSPKLVEFSQRRLRVWRILREIAGVSSPFTIRIRETVEQELQARNQSTLESLKLEYEDKIGALEKESDARVAQQLRERLLVLAGFGSDDQTERQ